MSDQRADLIARARALRSEIKQIFADAEHWNRMHTRQVPIDPDPDGELRRILNGLERTLSGEPTIQ